MFKKKFGAGVGVILLKDGKVLLGKRHSDPEKADSELMGYGTWTLAGGKLEYHESFEDCAIREVKEETDIDVKDVEVICVNNDMNEHTHFITIGIVAKGFEGSAKVMEPDEITEWQWFELDKLPSPLFMPSKHVLVCYSQKLFYIRREDYISQY